MARTSPGNPRLPPGTPRLPPGNPRLHYRSTDSTNLRLRELAQRGAPHGTLVTAGQQTAGRGRQGRSWLAPAGHALLASLLIEDPRRPLLPLVAGVAVAEACDRPRRPSQIKWPNDVVVDRRKVAGILVEARPQEGWAILGVGVNVAVAPDQLPSDLRDRATGLGLEPDQIETVLADLLAALERWLEADDQTILTAVRERDALRDHPVSWADGHGTAAGIDDHGRLLVQTGTARVALDSGEVHLEPPQVRPGA